MTVLLQNTSPKSPITDHYLLFQCDESLYNISTKYIKVGATLLPSMVIFMVAIVTNASSWSLIFFLYNGGMP